MERKEEEQKPQQQPHTDMDKDREAQKKPMEEREDNTVGKVPDPQDEDAERDRKES